MEVIEPAAAFAEAMGGARERGPVGFVPTMGALHAGHLSLIQRARAACVSVGVSIFVNPLQFGPNEDLARYPRDERADLSACEKEGVDMVWLPSVDDMYPPGVELPRPDPGPVGRVLEGASRPGHFEGVLTAVHRLFSVAGRCSSFFGEKDAQQLFLVKRMVLTEGMDIEVIACPTVREPDGLALSSRNAFLSDQEREQAGCLFLALSEAAELARAGERDPSVLVAAMAREIGATPLATIDYATVVDDATFEPASHVNASSRALVAARFPSARLIDNLMLSPKPELGEDGRG
jgi:pantoate--beta-alanine ligase